MSVFFKLVSPVDLFTSSDDCAVQWRCTDRTRYQWCENFVDCKLWILMTRAKCPF